jgi:malonate transporter and related proteins
MAMSSLAAALWPVAVLVAMGWLMRRTGFIPERDWPAIENLVYFVLFPSLLFLELARADLEGQPVFTFGFSLVAAQACVVLLAMASRRYFAISGPSYTSLIQGVVRWNSYVVIGLVPALFGEGALPLAAVAVALMVPFSNVVSVTVLARHGRAQTQGVKATLSALARNPLLVACALGIAWNILAPPPPPALADPLSILGQATLALGILAVGAGLRPITMPGSMPVLALAVGIKLLVKPAAVIAIGTLLGVHGAALGVAILSCAMPTATSSYILARLMEGDAELMAAIITTQTLVAFITVPTLLALAL